MLRITGIILACLFFMAPAEAQHRHHHKVHHAHHHVHRHVHRIVHAAPAGFVFFQPFSFTAAQEFVVHPRRNHHMASTRVSGGEIVAHPAGCPHIAFCGCGAVERLRSAWGVVLHASRSLWLAANWFRFARTAPAPGMVAVRQHHVFVLEANLGGGMWRVYDANSGGHMTRIHDRPLRGYTIVNPRS